MTTSCSTAARRIALNDKGSNKATASSSDTTCATSVKRVAIDADLAPIRLKRLRSSVAATAANDTVSTNKAHAGHTNAVIGQASSAATIDLTTSSPPPGRDLVTDKSQELVFVSTTSKKEQSDKAKGKAKATQLIPLSSPVKPTPAQEKLDLDDDLTCAICYDRAAFVSCIVSWFMPFLRL